MNLLKKILIHILIIMIILMSCFSVYFANKHGLNIYAAVNDDAIYVPLRSQSDAVIAFQSYCKSRDLTIEGSLTDAVTTFTTGAFNSACNEIGIDITELQAEIKAEYDASGKPVKFFFNDTGIMAMNRIFAQFLQDNELEVGDVDVNDTVFDGQYYNDDGNSALIYIIDSSVSENVDVFDYSGKIIQYGSSFMYTNQYIYDSGSNSIAMPFKNSGGTYNLRIGRYSNVNNGTKYMSLNFYNSSPSQYNGIINAASIGTSVFDGNLIIYKRNNGTTFHLASIFTDYQNHSRILNLGTITFTQQQTPQNTNIVIVSNTINNNNYEGDTYITNEGDIINNNPTIPYNPYPDGGGPTTPSTGIGDGNGTQLTLPDLDLNLPSINWSIGDLTEKFPFSIPFDLIAFLTILNAEPETPQIQGNLNLAIINWEFDYDLHQFDDLASLLRNLEFIGFCIGLVLITRSLLR